MVEDHYYNKLKTVTQSEQVYLKTSINTRLTDTFPLLLVLKTEVKNISYQNKMGAQECHFLAAHNSHFPTG